VAGAEVGSLEEARDETLVDVCCTNASVDDVLPSDDEDGRVELDGFVAALLSTEVEVLAP